MKPKSALSPPAMVWPLPVVTCQATFYFPQLDSESPDFDLLITATGKFHFTGQIITAQVSSPVYVITGFLSKWILHKAL